MAEEFQLNLSELARDHFRLGRRRLNEDDQRLVNEALKFAHRALNEYRRLEEESIEAAKADYLSRREAIVAGDLIAVVELNRSLRGRTTTAGDLWQALSYLLDRNLSVCDWETILTELEELALP